MPDILGTHVTKENRLETPTVLWRKNGTRATVWLIFVIVACLIAVSVVYFLPQYL